jgi:glycosyltransferase involved in cell wall biosynthesis
MKPFFTIITPTIERDSLRKCCEVIDSQTLTSWTHIIQVDSVEAKTELLESIAHPQRVVRTCGTHHHNGGNTCRRLALQNADSEYVYFCDDDNYLSDDHVLEDIAGALEDTGKPLWALFPIMRLGQFFYTNPPRSCHVDTMNFVLKREIADWPDTDAYGTDGILIDGLMEKEIPYVAFPGFRPIGIIPRISFCK